MKKFTKGCLITALVLFVLGCAFYIICGVMGGFGQLKAWNGHTFHMWGHEMRLAYSGYGFWYITDADADSGVEPADWADNGDQVGKGEKEKSTRENTGCGSRGVSGGSALRRMSVSGYFI